MSFETNWKRGSKLLLAAAAALAFSCAAGAQSSAPNDPTINQRKENQQDRIAQGVNSGRLTPGETSRLEGREASLNHEEHNMRAADNGHLTAGDRATINRQQNHLSHQIYRDKHNGK